MTAAARPTDELIQVMNAFLQDDVYPAETVYEAEVRAAGEQRAYLPVLENLKRRARELGLWNLFLPLAETNHAPLAIEDYAHLAELSGRSLHLAPEAMNCSAPDSGNMELLSMFATSEQKARWLEPLMAGTIRSSYAMTEPQVASSDASNIETTIEDDGDHWLINGRKWWISGSRRAECELLIVMGLTDTSAPRHRRHSVILVPRDTAGVTIERDLMVFGYTPFDSHVEMRFDDVRVPKSNILGEIGGGFTMAQARLGPGRIHHCMRMIGAAERGLELMIARASSRHAFGGPIVDKGVIQQWIAESRMEIDQARLYVLHTARLMDTAGNRAAASEISGIKVVAPNVAGRVLDRAIQVHGGAGLCQDFPLARMWAESRLVRIVDGPDEVHVRGVARTELKRFNANERDGFPGRYAHLRS